MGSGNCGKILVFAPINLAVIFWRCLDIRTAECNFFWNLQAPLCNKWEDIKSALGPYRKQYKSTACFIFSLSAPDSIHLFFKKDG